MDILLFTLISTSILIFFFKISSALDTISPSQSVSDGNTMVSRDRSFELGFFSPGSSKNRYVGIWYKNIPVRTVVWVANRENPINDSSGLLMINSTGNLVLLRQNNSVVWSTNSTKEAQYPIVQLLDSGNLVLRDARDGNSDYFLWQSFDYPSDTLLSGMKFGRDLRTGLNRRLSSWKNFDDPSPGEFAWEIELYNNPEGLMWKGSEKYFRGGPWNGVSFSGETGLTPNPVFDYNFVSNEEEVYFIFQSKNISAPSRLFMNQTNYLREYLIWSQATQTWDLLLYVPKDLCDSHAICGVYGNCVPTAMPACQCLKGFIPKSPEKWNTTDWSQGCLRNKSLNCPNGTDGFVKFSGLKLPETTLSWVNKTMNLKECKAKCLQNCSCMAYTTYDIRDSSGCAVWFGDLIDIRSYSVGGQDLYIRMSASELEANNEPKMKTAVIIVAAIVVVAGMLIVSYFICKRRANSKGKTENKEENKGDMELFDLATIANATNNFSSSNKLGEGGFGPVYKGTLLDGQEIAVKRLSRFSGQGLNELKNEVELITKLQHRNLVKLLGCCIQGEEKMLIYEYMPNKSLDFFIFDQTRGKLLDWSKRFHIICGIARGLLYLHEDSRLRIIHRDLKASNVLLDNELKPKISDFGLARTFRGDQTQGNTNRVVGTYGYMAPEYAIDGLFSVKSDVFSFGILLLEIISGKKNRGFSHPNHSLSLIEHAWRLWKEGKPLELIDTFLVESCSLSEVIRCIHISLLCVQHYPQDRPSLHFVVKMLGSESALPNPKQPGFFMRKSSLEAESSSSQREPSSINETSITLLEAR